MIALKIIAVLAAWVVLSIPPGIIVGHYLKARSS